MKVHLSLADSDAIKAELGQLLPTIKSSHRVEAMARGFGWNSNAALRVGLATETVQCQVDSRAFDGYLLQHGFEEFPVDCLTQAVLTWATSEKSDLFGVGPDILCVGEFLGSNGSEWALRVRSFLSGDWTTLTAYIDGFNQSKPHDRYVLVASIGDGRTLDASPVLTKDEVGHILRCAVSTGFPRIEAAQLSADWQLSADHDLMLRNGNWAKVSGLEALPQRLRTTLSHIKGESPFHRDAGTRLTEYYRRFRESPRLDQLFKLEVIRQASIPYEKSTPLQCVERVVGIKVLGEAPDNKWLPVRLDLNIKGVGRWQSEMTICVPSASH